MPLDTSWHVRHWIRWDFLGAHVFSLHMFQCGGLLHIIPPGADSCSTREGLLFPSMLSLTAPSHRCAPRSTASSALKHAPTGKGAFLALECCSEKSCRCAVPPCCFSIGTASEGDLKARLASARSELEAVSLERNALVRPPSPYGWFLVLLSGTGGCANGRLPRAAREFRSDKLVGDW